MDLPSCIGEAARRKRRSPGVPPSKPIRGWMPLVNLRLACPPIERLAGTRAWTGSGVVARDLTSERPAAQSVNGGGLLGAHTAYRLTWEAGLRRLGTEDVTHRLLVGLDLHASGRARSKKLRDAVCGSGKGGITRCRPGSCRLDLQSPPTLQRRMGSKNGRPVEDRKSVV